MLALVDPVPWFLVVLLCLTLGLAPHPEPHIVEKLGMLRAGTLVRPIDWFDLVMHGSPWVLLAMKAGRAWTIGGGA